MRILLLGATGMLGASLAPALQAAGHELLRHGCLSHAEMQADLTDSAAVDQLFRRAGCEVAINLVGMTDVDGCEARPVDAWRLNVGVAEHVASACIAHRAHLVHVSTDHVYEGAGPHPETRALPGNCYSQTKYAGELAALRAGGTILRTNFFGRSGHPVRRTLTDWLFDALREGRRIDVFDDVLFSPLCMTTLGRIVEVLVSLRPAGVFNVGSRRGMSKADFAFTFAGALALPTRGMRRVGVESATALKARRPRDMRMDTASLETILGEAMPMLADEICLAAEDYRAEL